MSDYWINTIRREEQRQKRQRAASADRRTAAIERGKEALGDYAAVAEHLGITRQAISDAVASAAQRTPGEPMADYIEIDLPRLAGRALTTEEWQALPDEERQEAARETYEAWSAILLQSNRDYRSHQADLDAMGEAMLEQEWESDQELHGLLSAALPHWQYVPMTHLGADAQVALLEDLCEAARRRVIEAGRQVEMWHLRAQGLDEPDM